MSEKKNCPWWIRWYHRRQRHIDETVLFPVIRAGAVKYRNQALAEQAIIFHKSYIEDAHWRCACADLEGGAR